jgi:hypothetical protein
MAKPSVNLSSLHEDLTALKIRIEAFIAAATERDRLYSERSALAADALKTAATELDKRLSAMNEWRATLQDRDKNYILQAVYDKQHDALVDRVTKIERVVYILIGGTMLLELIVPIILHFVPGK